MLEIFTTLFTVEVDSRIIQLDGGVPQLKVPRSAQIFIFVGEGGGEVALSDFLVQNLPCHFLEALASHILRMWRLNNYYGDLR